MKYAVTSNARHTRKVIIVKQFRVSFSANIARKARIFAKLLREKNIFQIFAVPKGTSVFPKGWISSAVEHFTRNEGVPSSNLGFSSESQQLTEMWLLTFLFQDGEKQGWNGLPAQNVGPFVGHQIHYPRLLAQHASKWKSKSFYEQEKSTRMDNPHWCFGSPTTATQSWLHSVYR